MITMGIDAGAEYLKVVVLDDSSVLSHAVFPYGRESVGSVAKRAVHEALYIANVKENQLEYTVATGIEREAVPLAEERIPESFCCAEGTTSIFPSTKTVVDLGTEKSLVIRCQDGKVLRTARNDRCAAGTGRYLKMVSHLLGMEVEKIGELSLQSEKAVEIQSTCAVFAESEIISLIHHNYAPKDILKGVFRGFACRLYPLLLNISFEKDVALIGGMAKNIGIVKGLEERAGFPLLVPEEPIIVGALGASIIAAHKRRGGPS